MTYDIAASTAAVGQTVRVLTGPKVGMEGTVESVRSCVQFGSLIPITIIDFADGTRSVRPQNDRLEVIR